MAELLSIAEAARELDRDPSRIRALVASGQLPGVRIGSQWAVDRIEVERRKRARPPAGRPFEPHNAWALLFLASGLEADWVHGASRWRLRSALALHGIRGLQPRLRRRAKLRRFRCHPGELRYLAEDEALVRSGISAAGEHGLGLVCGAEVDGYVRAGEVDRVAREHALVSGEPGDFNAAIRVVPNSVWHFDPGDSAAPLAAVALDLAEDPDSRSIRVGTEALRGIDRNHGRRSRQAG